METLNFVALMKKLYLMWILIVLSERPDHCNKVSTDTDADLVDHLGLFPV